MNSFGNYVIWWTGALIVTAFLAAITGVLLAYIIRKVFKQVLFLTRLVTVRYWVDRMESEGLTVCMKSYRKMVEEQKPKTIADFSRVSTEWERAQQSKRAEGDES